MLLWKSPSSCFPSLLCSDIYLTKSETGRKFLLDTGGQMGWYGCLLRPQPFICGPGSEITLSFVPFLDSTLFQTDAVRFNAVNSSFLHPYPIKKTLFKENGFTIQVLLDSWEPDKQHLKCAQMTSHQRLLMHHHTMLTNFMQFKLKVIFKVLLLWLKTWLKFHIKCARTEQGVPTEKERALRRSKLPLLESMGLWQFPPAQ